MTAATAPGEEASASAQEKPPPLAFHFFDKEASRVSASHHAPMLTLSPGGVTPAPATTTRASLASGSPAHDVAWTLACLRESLPSSHSVLPLREDSCSESAASESESSSDSEPLGLVRRPQQRLWAPSRGFFLSADVDTEQEDYSSGEEARAVEAEAQRRRRARTLASPSHPPSSLHDVAAAAAHTTAAIALAQALRRQREERRQRRAREHAACRQRQLEEELAEAEAAEASAAECGRSEAAAARAADAAADAAAARADAVALEARLAAVECVARERGALVAGMLQTEERERQQAAAAKSAAAAAVCAASEAAARAAAERSAAEKRAAEAAAAEAKSLADKQAAAALQAAAEPPARVSTRGAPRASSSALAQEKELAALLAATRAQAAPFRLDEPSKPHRRALEKRIVLIVQQISATRQQISRKAADLHALLTPLSGPVAAHAQLWLCEKLLSQCECQVARLHGFAYALADVVTPLAPHLPSLLPLLTAHLHEACCLSVPKVYLYSREAYPSEEGYLKAMGYQRLSEGGFEATDAYLGRTAAFVLLYAALMQADALSAEQGLHCAWAYLARLLNACPPCRESATALEALLELAGWRLHCAYGRQFAKLLHLVHSDFLPRLEAGGDAEARPVATRLRAYVEAGEHLRAHPKRDMPQTDVSTELKV